MGKVTEEVGLPGNPGLTGLLKDVASDLEGNTGLPGWQSESVTANKVTLANAGWIVAVCRTNSSILGFALVSSTPSVGQCQVEYDENGIATLTFNVIDSVSDCDVQVVPWAVLLTTQ